MKWYNFKTKWVNLEYAIVFTFGEVEDFLTINIHLSNNETFRVYLNNEQERDAEFEKIKRLLGIEEIQSRCC